MRGAWRGLLTISLLALTSACELVLGGIPEEEDARATDRNPISLVPDAATGDVDESDAGVEPAEDFDAGSQSPGGDGDDDVPAGPDPACNELLIWYADKDGDGYGVDAQTRESCGAPEGAWAPRGGDCADGDARVHPGQSSFYGDPYKNQAGADSFDFDCSGKEEGNPAQTLAPSRCKFLTFPSCGGAGYVATSRSGTGIHAYCGSTTRESCEASVAYVVCESKTKSGVEPYGCR
jgi:hypothetical protein